MITRKEIRTQDQYQPLFDFGTNLDPDGTRTGTIKQLLIELNQQYTTGDRADYDIKSLKITLGFISQLTGRKYKSITEELALSTLKTIKLLFATNNGKDIHLFQLIKPVCNSTIANMEYGTITSASNDIDGAPIITTLIEKLAIEIDEPRKSKIFTFLSSAEGLLQRIEAGTMAINRLFQNNLKGDDRVHATALKQLHSRMLEYSPQKEATSHIPVHEILCVHLLSLGFIHFASGYFGLVKKAKVKHPIYPIDVQLEAIRLRLSELGEADICSSAPIFSVSNYHLVVGVCLNEFRALVKAATGLGDRNKKFAQNAARARNILVLHAYRSYDETDADVHTLSLVDIAAAICSVRYQQKVKTEYDPRRFGQESQGDDPQWYLDRLSAGSNKAVQGFISIYMERFKEYRAAFMGTSESMTAFRAFELGRIVSFGKLLSLHDIELIDQSMIDFDAHCLQQAMELPKSQFPM